MGGHDGMSIFNSVERFDTNTGKWEAVPHMLSRRCRLGACALNGKIYACGGCEYCNNDIASKKHMIAGTTAVNS